MNSGEILYYVLLGFIAVWTGDVFGLWPRWQRTIEDWWRARTRR